jgi:peptide chain release factor subunit 1
MTQHDDEKVRSLASLRSPDAKVVSVYLDLDPSQLPAARRTQIESLLLDAESRYAKQSDDVSHSARLALREDINRVRTYLEGPEFSAKNARAVAVFCSSPAGLFEVVRLSRPVQSELVVDDSPFIEPLNRASSPDGWCVLLVNRRTSRVFRGTRERLEEVGTFRDEVHRWHDQGGWSQARYQRGIEKEIHDHIKGTCEQLFRMHKREPMRGLIVGAATQLWPEVEGTLHSYLRDLVVARVDVDVEHSNADEVTKVAAPVIEEEERRTERAALDRLSEGLGTGTRAAAGLDDVLAALNQQRVETLLLAAGFRAPGVACACGWAGTSGRTCPVDSGSLEARDDIVETAVEQAITQSADVRTVEFHDDLDKHGSIAAICRF